MSVCLDCGDRDTALASVAAALSVHSTELSSVLSEVDLEVECDRPDYDGDPNRALLRVVASRTKEPLVPINEVRWFHLTRVPLGTTFDEGVLPLSQSLDKVWATLLAVFEGRPQQRRLEQLRTNGVPDPQFQHKVGKDALAGPYAMLVRDSAFHSVEMGNHDYLGLPEIVEDICNGYRECFDDDIEAELHSALVPCIVTFRASTFRVVLLEAALRYLYSVQHGQRFTVWSNHIFDGRNVPVAREDILAIDHL